MKAKFAKPTASWATASIAAVVHGLAALLLVWPLSTPTVAISSGALAALAALLAPLAIRSRFRTHVAVLVLVVGVMIAFGVRALILGSSSLAHALGPSETMSLADGALFGVGLFSVSFGLRCLALRVRALSALEAGWVGIAFIQLLIAHRHGAIHRPHIVADPLIAAGIDPTYAPLAMGAMCALLITLLLLREARWLRLAAQLLVALLFISVVALAARLIGMPTPEATGLEMAERGESEDEQDTAPGGRDQQLEFRDNYQPDNVQVPVAVVLFHDDYEPPSGAYYFRQGAYSQFNGSRLVGATQIAADQDILDHFPTEPTEIDDAPVAFDTRKELRTTVALLSDHARPFGLETPIAFKPTRNPDASRFRRTYEVTSAALTADFFSMQFSEAGSPDWSPELRAHYLRAPDDPRYAALAAEIAGELDEDMREVPLAKALSVTQWLGQNGKYSLQSRHASAADPTADFLFGDKTGYCVHFAHAAVYMMRSLDVPARVASGYAVDEATREGGSALLITGAAAHAWPEVYLDGYGWVVLDVAVQTVLDAQPQAPDPELQRLLAELLRGSSPLPPDVINEVPAAVAGVRDLVIKALTFVGYAALFGLLGLLLLKLARTLMPSFRSGGDRLRAHYRRALDRLSDVGEVRAEGESREAFARRLAHKSPAFERITQELMAATYREQASAATNEDVDALSQAFRKEHRESYPWQRRLLGALTPWSWLRSR